MNHLNEMHSGLTGGLAHNIVYFSSYIRDVELKSTLYFHFLVYTILLFSYFGFWGGFVFLCLSWACDFLSLVTVDR